MTDEQRDDIERQIAGAEQSLRALGCCLSVYTALLLSLFAAFVLWLWRL